MYGNLKNYKFLVLLPISLLVVCLVIFFNTPLKLGMDFTGGVQITFLLKEKPSAEHIEKLLSDFHAKVRVAKGYEKYTVFVMLPPDTNAKSIVETLRKAGYDIKDYSVQKISPTLAKGFFSQMTSATFVAFLLMSVVVFFIFREVIPSLYVLFAVAADIFEAFALSQFLGIPLGIPVVAGLLLLIGYSADTDILLTTKVLKGEEKLEEALESSFKTGITMSLTTLAAVSVMFMLTSSEVLKSIAAVLLLGITADIINTWCFNGVVLRWWVERKK